MANFFSKLDFFRNLATKKLQTLKFLQFERHWPFGEISPETTKKKTLNQVGSPTSMLSFFQFCDSSESGDHP